MLFVCLLLCDSYRCSKLILIHKQVAIGSRARVFQYFTQAELGFGQTHCQSHVGMGAPALMTLFVFVVEILYV